MSGTRRGPRRRAHRAAEAREGGGEDRRKRWGRRGEQTLRAPPSAALHASPRTGRRTPRRPDARTGFGRKLVAPVLREQARSGRRGKAHIQGTAETGHNLRGKGQRGGEPGGESEGRGSGGGSGPRTGGTGEAVGERGSRVSTPKRRRGAPEPPRKTARPISMSRAAAV